MNVQTAIELYEGLKSIAATAENFPVKEGIKIVKNRNYLYPIVSPYIEMTNTIISKYADKDGVVHKGTEEFKKCNDELTELNAEQVDVDLPYKIKESVIEDMQLPLNFIAILEPMIEE